MTLGEAMARAKKDRPGEATDTELRTWLTQLDSRWREEVLLTHEGDVADFDGYATADESTALLIPETWAEVYIHWLYAKIDYRLDELTRYNNAAALFNQEWQEAARWYHRHHMPLETKVQHRVYTGEYRPLTPWL